jgi:hypothetical protein
MPFKYYCIVVEIFTDNFFTDKGHANLLQVKASTDKGLVIFTNNVICIGLGPDRYHICRDIQPACVVETAAQVLFLDCAVYYWALS